MINPLAPDKRIENLKKLAAASGHRAASRLAELAAFITNQELFSKLENYLGKRAAINPIDIDLDFLPGPSPDDLPQHGLSLGLLPGYGDYSVRLPIVNKDQGIFVTSRPGGGKSCFCRRVEMLVFHSIRCGSCCPRSGSCESGGRRGGESACSAQRYHAIHKAFQSCRVRGV